MIELQNVSRKFGNKKALADINLLIKKGKIIGLAGENGGGKSTLLKLMAGLLKPTNGSITLDGLPISRRSATQISYLPDADTFYPNFTVAQLFRFYESQFDDFSLDKASHIASFLNISLDDKLKNLSKGSRGRAKVAITLGRNTPYYLLDEPFSGFDPMVRQDIMKGLIKFTDTETQTIVLSTHEIREVEPLLDEIVILKGGQVIAYEETENIRDLYGKDTISWMMSLFKEGEEYGTTTNR
ncbi:ABC transporter ATP-binding protein [Paenisporosarcina sp. TG-14]|uniref:ABC transporter ATP-binding protein n=1 Tax=Paenisporosarcina sp. TG-14 TaxID=1231057 RepID=UPI0003041537|nr:ABC transporter ATP-binding protein [Paenisporosarcina sp. TG-14]